MPTFWCFLAGPSTARAQSDRLLGKMEEGGAQVQSFVSSSLSRLQTGAHGVGSSLGTTIQRCSLHSAACALVWPAGYGRFILW